MLRSTPESGARANYVGYNRTHGSKAHVAVDTLGNLLSAIVAGGKDQERHQAADLTKHLRSATEGAVEAAFVDQGDAGSDVGEAARANDVELEVVRTPEAKRVTEVRS